MDSSRWVQLFACVMAPLFVFIPALSTQPLDERREWTKTFGGLESSLPPEMVVPSVMLASFRGLAISYLWYRADKMQQEGKYFDADLNSEMITNLQPRFPKVWEFRAWNMAFNISVMTHTPEERWDWVSKGIELLRARGIPANPHAPGLYRELSWLFFFKIGGNTDDMNWHYKRALAREWQELLGEPVVTDTTEAAIDAFRAVANAPDTLAELRAEHPRVNVILDRLRELNLEPNEQLVRNVGRLNMGPLSPTARLLGRTPDTLQDPTQRAVAEMVLDADLGPAMEHLLNHLRKHTLVNRYKMQPSRMVEIMEEFGPIDWRHPAGHSLYWTYLGIDVSRVLAGERDINRLNVYRSVIHSLQMLALQGRLYYDPLTNRYDLMPDPRFFPAYERALDITRAYVETVEGWARSTGSFDAGHENFLINACVFSYLYGDKEQAAEYYNKARNLYRHLSSVARTDHYQHNLDDFVRLELPGLLMNVQHARQYIDALVLNGLRQGLSTGDRDLYETYRNIARAAHVDWTRGRMAGDDVPPEERLMLLPFPQLEAISYITYMRDPREDLLIRFRIWHNTPLDLRRITYDQLRPHIAAESEQLGVDVDRVLPEPDGMEAYREANPRALPESAIQEIDRVRGEGAAIQRR